MKKLSELAKFKKDLAEALDQVSLSADIRDTLCQLNFIKATNDAVEYTVKLTEISNQYEKLYELDKKILADCKELVETISKDFNLIGLEQLGDQKQQQKFTEENKNNIKLWSLYQDLPDEAVTVLNDYNDWRFPGLILAPRSTDTIQQMVANDPLYLVGDQDEIKSFITPFPLQYQKRLRVYARDQLNTLPLGQIGLAFTTNLFPILHFTEIEHYLKEVLPLLRPGGVFLFDYNNCELFETAEDCEKGEISFCSKNLIEQTVKDLGYELIEFIDVATEFSRTYYRSWAVVKKPGTLSSIKQHQPLGQVLRN